MNPYTAPLEDIRFVLRELVRNEEFSSMDDVEALLDTQLLDAILDEAARFSKEVLAPLDSVGDRDGAHLTDQGVVTPPGFVGAYKKFIEAGWNNVSIPAEHGGQGLPQLISAALQEMFVASNKAFCFCPEITAFCVKALANSASESLKSVYIPKLVVGEWTGTMNLTESQAGSDVGALRTRAVPQDDGSYRIFGQKIFISYGDHDWAENIVHLVLARTPDAPQGTGGVSLFLVPKNIPEEDGMFTRNEVSCTGVEHKLGNNASPTCTMVYGDNAGALGWLVGQENRGLQSMFVMVNLARFNVGLEGAALSERAYQQAVAYAQERVQGRLAQAGPESVPIIRHPDVRRMLLTMRTQAEAMRASGYLISASLDLASRHPDARVRKERQAFVDLMIPIWKGWASEVSLEVTSMSIQVHGGYGYIEESGVSQPFRDVRVATIYEGTTSIQAHDLVERKIVRDGGAAMRAWMMKIQQTIAQLHSCDASGVAGVGVALEESIRELQATTEWVLAHYKGDPLRVLAGSVPFLRLCGAVLGGWQMGVAALAAQRYLDEGVSHADFYIRKQHSTRFYCAHILPQARSWAEVVVQGGESVMDLDGVAFA